MKLAVIGATGKQGSRIVTEALSRNIDVTGIVRNRVKLTVDIPVIEKEIKDITKEDVAEFDVVVNAFAAPITQPELHVEYGRHLIEIFTGITTRLIIVGGASSLYIDNTKTDQLFNHLDVPDELKGVMKGQLDNEKDYEKSSIRWTFVSPASFFDPNGPKTGHYQVFDDVMHNNHDGESYVSYDDYASAIVDEAQQGLHVQEHISVVSDKN